MNRSILLAAGCSKEQQATAPRTSSKPKSPKELLKEPFKTQLVEFLSTASQLNAATETGVSRSELQRLVSAAKGKFDLLEAIWPEGLFPDSKSDFRQAINGWSYAASGEFGSKYGDDSAKALQTKLEEYESANPFGVKFHYMQEGVIPLSAKWGDYLNNMPALLGIASKYFDRGKDPVYQALKE